MPGVDQAVELLPVPAHGQAHGCAERRSDLLDTPDRHAAQGATLGAGHELAGHIRPCAEGILGPASSVPQRSDGASGIRPHGGDSVAVRLRATYLRLTALLERCTRHPATRRGAARRPSRPAAPAIRRRRSAGAAPTPTWRRRYRAAAAPPCCRPDTRWPGTRQPAEPAQCAATVGPRLNRLGERRCRWRDDVGRQDDSHERRGGDPDPDRERLGRDRSTEHRVRDDGRDQAEADEGGEGERDRPADQPAVQEIDRGPADHAATGSRTRTAPFGPSTTTSAACSTPSVTSR